MLYTVSEKVQLHVCSSFGSVAQQLQRTGMSGIAIPNVLPDFG